jgi:uncharacterized membrane protein
MNRKLLLGGSLSLFSFVGLVDSAYVAISSLNDAIVPCHVTRGCEEVLNSPYARVGGYSIAWLGVAYYALICLVGVFAASGYFKLLRYSLVPAGLAFLVTLLLVYLQAFVLHSFCEYCLMSAAMSILILMVHLLARPWEKDQPA